MAELFQRTVSVENKRGETPPTIDDVGTERFKLRGGDDRAEVIGTLRGEAARTVKFAITEAPVAENGEVVVHEEPMASSAEKHELSPEDTAATLRALEARFTTPENLKLHEGVSWDRVKVALETNPEALWSINKMQAAGHDPDVYDADSEGFDIGTCSKESPVSGRNCVYDAKAAKWLKDNRSGENFNGSAVKMAEDMGIKLMHPDKYENVLQVKDKFDLKTWSYLLTDEATRNTGHALDGYRDDFEVDVGPGNALDHCDDGAWRGSLRVKWAA